MADLGQGIPSPCNKICVLNADKVCLGCGRSSEEIARWSQAGWDEQLQIVTQAAKRLADLSQTQNTKR